MMARIVFADEGKQAKADLGVSLRKIMNECGIRMRFACGDGRCGICLVRIARGMEFLNEPSDREKMILELLKSEPDKRLACQCIVEGDGEIVVSTQH